MKNFIWLFLVGLLLPTQSVSAANFLVGAVQNEVHVGEEIAVNIGIDTEGARLNLFSTEIVLPDGVEFVNLSADTSVVSVWVREPAYNEDSRAVSLIGGVPGGTIGRVVLATVHVRAKAPGTYNFAVAEASEAYLNDGLGTKVEIKTQPWTLEVREQPGRSYVGLALIAVAVVIIMLWWIIRKRK